MALGTRGELPQDYLQSLTDLNLVPLWPSLRDVLPYGGPGTRTRPMLWDWARIRPLLMRAGELTPMDKAERRVLVLANPGRGLDNLQASSAIYLGMQLVLPGEVAPNHQHTPNAARVVVEGDGACTVVGGVKCPMEHGDLILTPTWLWHEHRHEGKTPVVWLDVLDLPLIHYLDASYAIEGQPQRDHAHTGAYNAGGLAPLVGGKRSTASHPRLRFPWRTTRDTLDAYAPEVPAGQAVHLAYVNPETGGDAMNTMAFSALKVRPGETVALARVSTSRVFHVIDGDGQAEIAGQTMSYTRADTFVAPCFAPTRLANRSSSRPLYLLSADESPVHKKLGIHELRDA